MSRNRWGQLAALVAVGVVVAGCAPSGASSDGDKQCRAAFAAAKTLADSQAVVDQGVADYSYGPVGVSGGQCASLIGRDELARRRWSVKP